VLPCTMSDFGRGKWDGDE